MSTVLAIYVYQIDRGKAVKADFEPFFNFSFTRNNFINKLLQRKVKAIKLGLNV
jgi:hypothetical protein